MRWHWANTNFTGVVDGLSVGISFGTTSICACIWRDGRAEIIPDVHGNTTTPACVTFTDTGRCFGVEAIGQTAMGPVNFVFALKKLIGRKADDSVVRNQQPYWSFTISPGIDGRAMINVVWRCESKQFSAEELIAMLLGNTRRCAEKYTGAPVKNAVICVPAFFNNSQRQSIKDAAHIAGLNVFRIISEPSSVALAFGVSIREKGEKREKVVLVFNLGGGSCDVSLSTIEDGIVEVKATAGLSDVGGENFDNRLVDHFVLEFKRKFKKDISDSQRAMFRLRRACERAKKAISISSEASIEIDSLFEGADFSAIITRARFEELSMDYFRKCMEPVEKVLKDAKISKSQVNEIVLVGGSTRIPKVQELLSEFFNGKELNKSMNVLEAAAAGASIQAAIRAGIKSSDRQLDDVLLLDVCSHSVGIETLGGVMTTMIKRNTTISVVKSVDFFVTELGAAHSPSDKPSGMISLNRHNGNVLIEVFEGERAMTKDNQLLDRFELTAVPMGAVVQVVFSIDFEGILTVSATEKSTGKEKKITIKNDKGRMSAEEMERLVQEAERYEAEDEADEVRVGAKNALENYVFQVKFSMNDDSIFSKILAGDKTKVTDACSATTQWLDSNQAAEKEEFEERQKALEAVVAPVLQNLSGIAPC